MSENKRLLVLLIDGDNVPVALIPQILEAVSDYGNPVQKRIYGDWSQERLKNWKPLASKYNIEMVHHYNVSIGKNATDIALVIGAMDILHERRAKFDGFCIVSSDSDFTHLARRIRKEGLFVLGVGRDGSPTLTDAYDTFIALESLPGQDPESQIIGATQSVQETADEDFLKGLTKAHKRALKKSKRVLKKLSDLP